MTQTNAAPPLILIGPMGAGKTTIGKRLAARLDCRFVDSDAEIERRTGVDIPCIFEHEGEAGFRAREEKIIGELCRRSDHVIATGGGAVLSELTRRRLSAGFVIYLQTSVEEQLRRVRHDGNRPLLRTDDPEARLRELLKIRDPLYRQVADFVVDTSRGHIKQALRKILQRLDQITPEDAVLDRNVPPPFQGGGQEGV